MRSNEKIGIGFIEKSCGSFRGFLHGGVRVVVRKQFSVEVSDLHIFPHYPMTVAARSTEEIYLHPKRKQADRKACLAPKSGISTSLAPTLAFSFATYDSIWLDNP
jgi:hypothetical protein